MFTRLLLNGKIIGSNYSPTALETTLGYVLMGNALIDELSFNVYSHCALNQNPLNQLLEKFWNIEELPHVTYLSPEEVQCENMFVSFTTRNADGRYCVKLPFKENPQILGNSYDTAMKRYLALERRFNKSADLRIRYNAVIQEYLAKNYLSPVFSDSPTDGYYIPHHPVIRNDKDTTKLRIVLDASAKTDANLPLNDMLHTGRNLQAEIFK